MKALIRCSVSMLALAAWTVPAHAQDQAAPPTASTPVQNAPQGAAVTSTTPQDDTGLQDVIVTAQRVEQSAQTAPIAISVVRPEDLVRQGVARAEDLSRVVPALAASSAGGANTVFFIRGVGNFTQNAYSDAAIAFNYDGVYIGRPSSTSGSFYDLQRVEVLKGPQGTLYGRNATGGAINVIPNKPRVGVTSLDFSGSYGNYNTVQAQAAGNLPIGETGAFRLAGTYVRHDGYANDGTGDQLEYGVRAQIYADLTPDLNIRVSADYAHQGGDGTASYYIGRTAPTFGPTGFAGYSFTPSGLGVDEGLLSPRSQAYLATYFSPQAGRAGQQIMGDPYNSNDYWGILAEMNWTTSAGTLTIVPAYREADLDNLFIQPGFNNAITLEHDQQASVEARWAGKFGTAIDYLVGGFYYKEDITASPSFSQFTLTPFQNLKTATESYAAFGKLSAHLGHKLTLTAAGRYTDDKKRFDGVSDIYILFCGNPAPPQDFCPTVPFLPSVRSAAELRAFYAARGIPVTPAPLFVLPPQAGGSQTAPFVLNSRTPINSGQATDKFTYRLAAEYQLATQSLLYASFETGYHSGGFSFAKGLESYRPETIDAYTIGSKNRFANNRVQFNVEGFYWKYRDQQYSQFGFDLGTPPASVFLTRNIGRSTIYGIDADAQFLLTRNTLLAASVQYLHTRYDSFTYFTPNQGVPPVTSCGFSPTTQNGQPVFAVDCSGKPGFNAPKWSFNANGQQTVPFADHKLILQAGTRYRDRSQIDAAFSPYVFAKSGTTSNASVTFAPADERWFLTAFVNNIEDFRRLVFTTQSPGGGNVVGSVEPPRTYGIRFGGKF